jgi:hypothetical protein
MKKLLWYKRELLEILRPILERLTVKHIRYFYIVTILYNIVWYVFASYCHQGFFAIVNYIFIFWTLYYLRRTYAK